MAKTTVVIGSNCFTGSHIVANLLSDPDRTVIGLSRSPEYADFLLPYKQMPHDRFRFHQLDLTRHMTEILELLDCLRPEVVINVAALSEVGLSNFQPVEYFDVNTSAVVRLCNHLRSQDYLDRYVHISSAEIFGSCDRPASEETLFNPSTPYAVSKAAADMYLGSLIRNFGFPALLIRSTNVYGRFQQLFKIIPRTVIYLKKGRILELHGGGTSRKSFVHVRDVVHGMRLALDQGKTGTYHFSVPSEQTVAELVALVCNRMGFDFAAATRVVGERLGQDSQYVLECSKARHELGWAPGVSIEEGIEEVISWVNRHWSEIEGAPLTYEHKV